MRDSSGGSDGPAVQEPIRKPWVWVVLVILILAGVPWYWPPGTIQPVVLGVPLWALIVMASSVVLAAYLSWLCRTQWHMSDEDAEHAGDEGDTRGDATGESGR